MKTNLVRFIGLVILVSYFITWVLFNTYSSFIGGFTAPIEIILAAFLSFLNLFSSDSIPHLSNAIENTWGAGSLLYKIGLVSGVIFIFGTYKYTSSLFKVSSND